MANLLNPSGRCLLCRVRLELKRSSSGNYYYNNFCGEHRNGLGRKRGPSGPKAKTQARTCQTCKKDFLAADPKTRACPKCAKRKTRKCQCGCKGVLERSDFEFYTLGKQYLNGHSVKGKTYKEIYGTDTPACGFKPGKDNVAQRPEVRAKISEAIKKISRNGPCFARGKTQAEIVETANKIALARHRAQWQRSEDGYLSSYEAQVAEFFKKHKVKFVYEPTGYRYYDGYMFVPDFVVGDVLIEVTGFAYDAWQRTFVRKIAKLRKSYRRVVVVTADNLVEKARSMIPQTRIFSLENLTPLLRYLQDKGVV